MPNLTQLITRQSGLAFWYPLTNDDPGNVNGLVNDESGNGRDMSSIGLLPGPVTLDQINGYPAVVHDDSIDDPASIRLYSGALLIKDFFIVAKVDDTPDFDDPFRGLVTGIDDTNFAVLVGKGSTTRWLSNAEGGIPIGYHLDDVLQNDTARSAPFDDFHRIRISTSGSAVVLDGIQVGRDREHVDRMIKAKWTDLMGFTSQRTVDEAKAIGLYQDLKFNLWRTNGTLLNFPTPGMTGIAYRHFNTLPKRWDDAVISHQYEDLGRSFNEITDTPPQEWNVEFDCVSSTHTLAKSQYEIFDSFWDAVRTSKPFNFTDKYGETHTNVRIKEYSRSHSKHKSWQNEVAFTLCKYPG